MAYRTQNLVRHDKRDEKRSGEHFRRPFQRLRLDLNDNPPRDYHIAIFAPRALMLIAGKIHVFPAARRVRRQRLHKNCWSLLTLNSLHANSLIYNLPGMLERGVGGIDDLAIGFSKARITARIWRIAVAANNCIRPHTELP